MLSLFIARLSHDWVEYDCTARLWYIYSVGNALGAFWPGRDTGKPTGCACGRENSVVLQALGVFGLCLQVMTVYYGMVCSY